MSRNRARGMQQWRRSIFRAKQWRRDPRCGWCHATVLFEKSTIDHVVPLAKGGSDSPDNWMLSCFTCNHSRGDSIGPPKHVLTRAERRARGTAQ